uniref:vascular endothelial growth factor A-like isoform X2 n=1 Tax=Myxine glutinosa TaxID=7769 RepID=UPI00358F6745
MQTTLRRLATKTICEPLGHPSLNLRKQRRNTAPTLSVVHSLSRYLPTWSRKPGPGARQWRLQECGGDMQHCAGFMAVGFLVLLHLIFVRASTVQVSIHQAPPSTSHQHVLPFEEVLARSYCRPVETMVGVAGEVQLAPGASVRPVCVQLRRCTGCCTDGARVCQPSVTQLVQLQILQIRPLHGQHVETVTFTEHSSCECRLKEVSKQLQTDSGSCKPCSARRPNRFQQDPVTCQCSCRLLARRCEKRGRSLDRASCRCRKPRR